MPRNGMRPIHPGEILREDYLKPMIMSVNELSRLMRVSAARMNDIVRERRGITPDTALRLAMFFGGDPQSWMNLQIAYDLKMAEKESLDRIAKEVTPLALLKDRLAAMAAPNDEGFALGA